MSTPAEILEAAVAQLRDAGAPTEVRLAVLRAAFGRTKLRVAGEVWRLGALCLDADATLFATGDVLLVAEPTHPNFRSEVALERNELRGLALRAGVRSGTTVVIDARPLDPGHPEPPLVSTPEGVGVLWTAGGAPIPLATYLGDRVELLLNPPERA